MTDPTPNADLRERWLFLLDPIWQQSAAPDSEPPPEAIVGGWYFDSHGERGPFEPNPQYIPAEDSVPTDPVDAVVRLAIDGDDIGAQIAPTLRDAMVEVACDERDQPVVGPAPDGTPCLAVVTAAVHKRRIVADRWHRVVGSALPDLTPVGVDLLLNPGSPTQFRLFTEALRTTK
ncbi:type VII secretion system-associated protein [Nocardia sp. NPDC004568]|uniref:type VII secretion system-associated protein n=1 Tax=Nocardia sp. NPDC004568 TaxID=3154551 RepID=UPI0033A729C5